MAFLVARSQRTEAALRLGETGPAISTMSEDVIERIFSIGSERTASQNIAAHAVVTMEVFPSNEKSFNFPSSITRNTSRESPQVRFSSKWETVAFSKTPLFGGFFAYSRKSPSFSAILGNDEKCAQEKRGNRNHSPLRA